MLHTEDVGLKNGEVERQQNGFELANFTFRRRHLIGMITAGQPPDKFYPSWYKNKVLTLFECAVAPELPTKTR